MKSYYDKDGTTIYNGNCVEVMKELEDNSVDAIVTDPPYGLEFMGKEWDKCTRNLMNPTSEADIKRKKKYGKNYSGRLSNLPDLSKNKPKQQQEWHYQWAKECLRVLKPGGYLLAFGGTRTYQRMAVAIEDAGFEIRDMIEWVYGSGFPKSHNIGKAVDKLQGNEREVIGKEEVDIGMQSGSMHAGRESKIIERDKTKGTSEYEGWGTALKPAHEPICMARKPLDRWWKIKDDGKKVMGKVMTVAENVLKWGTGGINIDESRVGTEEKLARPFNEANNTTFGKYEKFGNPIEPSGRFPANLIHDNSEEVRECFPEVKGKKPFKKLSSFNFDVGGEHKKQKYESQAGLGETGNASRFFKSIPQGRFPANLIHDNSEEVRECFPENKSTQRKNPSDTISKPNIDFGGGWKSADNEYADSGNASRFFKSIIYQAKASKSERNKGCEGLEKKLSGAYEFRNRESGKGQFDGQTNTLKANNHPTVKPIALMEYLIRMVSREGGTILDPFMGSGTTGIASKNISRDFIGIEISEEYCEIAKVRIDGYQIQYELF